MILKLLMFFLITLNTPESYSQTDTSQKQTPSYEGEVILSDTVNFSYKLYPGDTLFYRIASWDSIIVNFNEALLKQRLELVRITCDSVTKSGKMYLSHTLLDLRSKEAGMNDETGIRTNSPWIGRTSHIVIDSTGKRLEEWYRDSTGLAITPGGTYMPYLLFNLGATQKSMNESWLQGSTDTLVENSFPPAIFKQTTLFRVFEDIDTLGYECSQLMYVRTAQGKFYAESGKDTISTTCVINASGKFRISELYHFPVHQYVTQEQKIEIYRSDGNKVPVWHYIHTDFVLERFVESPLRPKVILEDKNEESDQGTDQEADTN